MRADMHARHPIAFHLFLGCAEWLLRQRHFKGKPHLACSSRRLDEHREDSPTDDRAARWQALCAIVSVVIKTFSFAIAIQEAAGGSVVNKIAVEVVTNCEVAQSALVH